jgi:hypothetical protein
MSKDDASKDQDDAGVSGDAAESSESGPGDSGSRLVRGRELARLARRQAYQRAKEMRAKDPKYLAMKQLAKDRRREAGKAFRAKRKAEQGVERKAEKKESAARRTGERAARDQQLRELLTRGAAPAKEPTAGTGDAPDSPGAIEGSEEHAPLLRVRSPRSDYDVN